MTTTNPEDAVSRCQASVVLTVAESKRLIAKGVAAMPIVKEALAHGTVIITPGSTNTYVAEEILGRSVEHGIFIAGRTQPAKGGRSLKPKGSAMSAVILRQGKEVESQQLDETLKNLKAGDVVIKGANALDYDRRTAGILIGHPTSGNAGKHLPTVVARKAHLVIPVGLEKLCPGVGDEIARRMRQPLPSLNEVPSMFLVTGEIISEIEALRLLADVEAFQAAAGGIGGAEGGRWLVLRGPKENVERALQLVQTIQGEPEFTPAEK